METQNHPRPHQRTPAEINPLAAAPVAINTAAGHSPIDAAIEAQNKAIVGIVTKAMGSISNELKKQHAAHKKFYLFGETSTQVVPKKILLKFQIFLNYFSSFERECVGNVSRSCQPTKIGGQIKRPIQNRALFQIGHSIYKFFPNTS